MIDLGSFWSSKTTPFGDQHRPKISPRPVLRRLCFKNVVFQNMSPALGESTILTLLGSQDGTKVGPRSPQDRLKIVLKGDRFLRRFLIDFWSSWAPFWLPFWHPRWVQKSIKRGPRVMSQPSWRVNTPQDRPKSSQERSRSHLGTLLGAIFVASSSRAAPEASREPFPTPSGPHFGLSGASFRKLLAHQFAPPLRA